MNGNWFILAPKMPDDKHSKNLLLKSSFINFGYPIPLVDKLEQPNQI